MTLLTFLMLLFIPVLSYNINVCCGADRGEQGGPGDTLVDQRDQRVYKSVKIGDQWWMAENLAYLPRVDPPSVGSDSIPAYYVYDFTGNTVIAAKTTVNFYTYGVLYNWAAAQDACPAGWHLPTETEWDILENYLISNAYNYDQTNKGNKIAKALSAAYGWEAATRPGAPGNTDFPDMRNASGFSALPAGAKSLYNYFYNGGSQTIWWTATNTWCRYIDTNFNTLSHFGRFKKFGLSVRCVKD